MEWGRDIFYMLSMLLVLQSGQRRTQAELDSRVALGATPCFCLALMLHALSSLLPREYLGINEIQGRPWPGSSSGPKHVSLDLGRMRRMLGVHASQEGSKTSVNVVCSWEAIQQGHVYVMGPRRRLACQIAIFLRAWTLKSDQKLCQVCECVEVDKMLNYLSPRSFSGWIVHNE